MPFQSTRPIWGATRIHRVHPAQRGISIHAPHMGRDCSTPLPCWSVLIFQSTRPIWGATGAMLGMSNWKSNISIHAPHMGRDTHCTPLCATGFYFNPRAPYGARLRLPSSTLLTMLISIHAPHMGRDDRRDGVNRRGFDFNPRAPYGARHGRKEWEIGVSPFQSTRPIWGATSNYIEHLITQALFQSTRPIWGATPDEPTDRDHHPDFNPRAPYGARRVRRSRDARGRRNFNPRAPYGARLNGGLCDGFYAVFQSTRPIWGATVPPVLYGRLRNSISIHAPHMGRDSKNA